MSPNGLINKVPDHSTYQQKYGEWVTFKYAKYLYRQNHSKHWVDDVNNRRHDPIGLDNFWHTNFCPHENLLPFALLPRPTPYTPGPVGGRRYLSLNLNFAGN